MLYIDLFVFIAHYRQRKLANFIFNEASTNYTIFIDFGTSKKKKNFCKYPHFEIPSDVLNEYFYL